MRKRKSELVRVQNVIENDRLNLGLDFNKLIENDLIKLLSDYFDLSSGLDLKLEKHGDRYKIQISCYAVRVKQFGVIPSNN